LKLSRGKIILALWEVHMQSKMAQDFNKVAEGLVTTVEVSEGVVDSLCAQEWDEGLSMDHLQERSMDMGVEGPGWDQAIWESQDILLLECHLSMVNILLRTTQWHSLPLGRSHLVQYHLRHHRNPRHLELVLCQITEDQAWFHHSPRLLLHRM